MITKPIPIQKALTEIFSSGGGTQSACIAALIIQGRLPKPDFAVIVDTEREHPAVWQYHDSVIKPELASVGVAIHRVPKSEFATVDLWSKGKGGTTLPVFFEGGKAPTHCSNEWKVRVLNRFVRSLGVPTERQRRWIGFSLDEGSRYTRMKLGPDAAKGRIRFPLIEDVPLTRQQAIREVEKMGWPRPPRSACWMCPNHTQREWRDLKLNWPVEFQMAVELEREVRAKEPQSFFHQSKLPLDEVDFGNEDDLFSGVRCNSGMCFV